MRAAAIAGTIVGALVLQPAPTLAQAGGGTTPPQLASGALDAGTPGQGPSAATPPTAKPTPSVPTTAQPPSLAATDSSLELFAVQPAVAYPKAGHFDLVLTGRGFTNELAVLIDGRQIPICWHNTGAPVCPPATETTTARPASAPPPGAIGTLISDREVHVSGLSASELHGPHDLQLRLDRGPLSTARTVTFSRLAAFYPSLIALALTVVLFLIVLGLIRLGPSLKTAEGFDIGPVEALFLDKETETYSLSRLQFYAWTFACVFAYAFLALARALVQGKVELPDVPASFPGILAISAGTTIAAVGITSARGPAGTGPMRPSFADLVSAGGMVVPERFQFLIWTAVGVLGFLLMVVLSDPATATSVPALPEGFLYLSGISAFGYLGGKMARKAGPMIDGARLVSGDAGGVQIQIRGRNISDDATVRLAGVDLSRYAYHVGDRGSVIASEVQGAPDTTRTLRISLSSGDRSWLSNMQPPAMTRRLPLAVTNPDGQMAETYLDLSSGDEQILTRLPFPPPPPASPPPSVPTPVGTK